MWAYKRRPHARARTKDREEEKQEKIEEEKN